MGRMLIWSTIQQILLTTTRTLSNLCCKLKFVSYLQRDRAAIDRLITKGEKELRSKLHPDPYIGEACSEDTLLLSNIFICR